MLADVVGGLGQRARELLDRGVAVELERIEIAAMLRALVFVPMQDLRFGLDLELAQLFLQARDGARQLAEVELDRADLLLDARAADARLRPRCSAAGRAARRRRAPSPARSAGTVGLAARRQQRRGQRRLGGGRARSSTCAGTELSSPHQHDGTSAALRIRPAAAPVGIGSRGLGARRFGRRRRDPRLQRLFGNDSGGRGVAGTGLGLGHGRRHRDGLFRRPARMLGLAAEAARSAAARARRAQSARDAVAPCAPVRRARPAPSTARHRRRAVPSSSWVM